MYPENIVNARTFVQNLALARLVTNVFNRHDGGWQDDPQLCSLVFGRLAGESMTITRLLLSSRLVSCWSRFLAFVDE